ncbi:hypothetical protein EYF80_031056 [Liparis tanakae]|uniref:Uncharacterized protein n=1 Tax=Liparis tanakae TaxID=230148 RepID=A0A4Z2GZI8_9TELE|nr:hypothetical protein EYF80_031056 [Liparis tanakae]
MPGLDDDVMESGDLAGVCSDSARPPPPLAGKSASAVRQGASWSILCVCQKVTPASCEERGTVTPPLYNERQTSST